MTSSFSCSGISAFEYSGFLIESYIGCVGRKLRDFCLFSDSILATKLMNELSFNFLKALEGLVCAVLFQSPLWMGDESRLSTGE